MNEVAVAYRQVGWMRCIACSDSKLRPGHMWLGVVRGKDDWIVCPECKGTAQVPKYQVIDVTTGKEIDYEARGRSDQGEAFHHIPRR